MGENFLSMAKMLGRIEKLEQAMMKDESARQLELKITVEMNRHIDLFNERINYLENRIGEVGAKTDRLDTAIVTPQFVYDAIELKLKQPIQDMNAQFWFEQAEFFKNQTQDLCHKIMDKDELIKSLKEEIKELKKRHEWLVNQTPHNKRLDGQFNGGCCL